jgi:uncharacterized membrane protein
MRGEEPARFEDIFKPQLVRISMTPPVEPPEVGSPEPTRIVERNFRALPARRLQEEHARSWQDRLADRITHFTGSMRFVYLHLVIFGLCIAINLPWPPLPRFDPSYVIPAMAASIEAIFLSTFILITQSRMTAQADTRADLDLQVSLLAEHEITRLVTLVTAMAQRMGIPPAQDPELAELAQDIAPEKVRDTMEAHQRQSAAAESQSREP